MSMRLFAVAALIIAVSLGTPIFVSATTGTTQPPAQTGTGMTGTTAKNSTSKDVFLVNPLKGVDCKEGSGKCLMNFLGSILDFVILIGAIVVVLMTVFVGYKFVVAQGEPGKISEARQALLWTVVGALILLGSKAISEAITLTVKELGG